MENKLETERLFLTLITCDDAPFIFQLLNSPNWIKFIGDRNIHSLEDAQAYILKILDKPNVYYWIARLKENGASIGLFSLMKRDYLDFFDIGYSLLDEHIQNGYSYEASQKVLVMAKSKLINEPILAITLNNNTQSIKLLNKLGFVFEKEQEVNSEQLQIFKG